MLVNIIKVQIIGEKKNEEIFANLKYTNRSRLETCNGIISFSNNNKKSLKKSVKFYSLFNALFLK